MRVQRVEEKKMQEFRYLELTVKGNGECGKEVTKRVLTWRGEGGEKIFKSSFIHQLSSSYPDSGLRAAA